MNKQQQETPAPELALHYRAAYLRLFGAVAALAERIETAGVRMSLADVRDALERAMQAAEDAACADQPAVSSSSRPKT